MELWPESLPPLAVDGAAQYLTTGGTVSLRARVTYTGQTPAAR